jgi:hypothetical protein
MKEAREKMKKLLVVAIIAGLMGLSLVAAFAIERQGPTAKPLEQKLFIKGNDIRIISAENDKSQPTDSLTQRYRLVVETADEQRHTAVIELQMNDKGKIVRANIISAPKAASMEIYTQAQVQCDPPCRIVCTHIIDFEHNRDIYICWCCCRRVC